MTNNILIYIFFRILESCKAAGMGDKADTKVQLASQQNVWLSSEKVLPRNWLPSYHDPAIITPWREALSSLGLHLALSKSRTAPTPLHICILGGLGWHALTLHDGIIHALGSQSSEHGHVTDGGSLVPLACVESIYHDRLSFALAQALIRANMTGSSQRLAEVTVSMMPSPAETAVGPGGTGGDAVDLKILDEICQRAAVYDGVMPQVTRGPSNQVVADGGCAASSREEAADILLHALVCVDACSSRLSLQQLASQLWQVGSRFCLGSSE